MFYKYFVAHDGFRGFFLDRPNTLKGTEYNAVGRFSRRNDFMPGELGLKTFPLQEIKRGFTIGEFKLLKTKPKRRDMRAFITYVFTRKFD